MPALAAGGNVASMDDQGGGGDPSDGLTRRRVVQGALGAAAMAAARSQAGAATPGPAPGTGEAPAAGAAPRVAVVGAGAFGGWTALWLGRLGARVTLVDAWGPGNSRASSGGETRVIRGIYGPDRVYTQWVVRAFELWKESARAWDLDLYHPTGALWMFEGDDSYARAALPLLAEAGLSAWQLDLAEIRGRYPQIDLSGVTSAFFEDEAGYLTARRACQAVARAVVAEGGTYRVAAASPGAIRDGRMEALALAGGGTLEADLYVFACGPWLGRLFPEVVGPWVRPSRQEVFFFGLPAGESRFSEASFPVWVDFGERVFYGIPGNEERGFKVADDTHGEEVDPDSVERLPSAAALERARAFLARRFPALAGAPLVESRVCQYENTPDGHYLIDRHPEAANAWIVGGGSGHGFKVAPALGERVAAWVLGREEPLERFSLARLAGAHGERSQLSGGHHLWSRG
jgi:glycine/D-amino acid oxidase-like deaminating enzyme